MMAGHPDLLCFCVTTSGQNGDDLGTDEKPITEIEYLLLDGGNLTVRAVQQISVRPLTSVQLGQTVQSTERLCETESTQAGLPLKQALLKLDNWLQSTRVQTDRPVLLVTDGQAPLRQCLHPQADHQDIHLPPYFYQFCDLRKEFQRHYKTSSEANVQFMNDYLGLQEDSSTYDGVGQCRQMSQICLRLIADGHCFYSIEIIQDKLEPGICSNDPVNDNLVIRARGLPWLCTDQDVARFFRGLNIAKGGVALCLSAQGRRNGEALIRMESEEHRDMALRRHKHHLGRRYIEVFKATGAEFVGVVAGSSREARAFLSRGSQTIVRMRGLPFSCTTLQVVEFFSAQPFPCHVLDGEDGILFVHYPDGRSTGDAFVLFATEEESETALKKHREIMGNRYIELFKSTPAEVQQVLNRSRDPRHTDSSQTFLTSFPTDLGSDRVPQALITSGRHRDCIRLRNLPSSAHVTDILTFLGEFSLHIVQQGLHLVYTATGRSSGEAFIQLESEEVAARTVAHKHRQPMSFASKKRCIDVIQCSGDEMNLVLTHRVLPTSCAAFTTELQSSRHLPSQMYHTDPSPLNMLPTIPGASQYPGYSLPSTLTPYMFLQPLYHQQQAVPPLGSPLVCLWPHSSAMPPSLPLTF